MNASQDTNTPLSHQVPDACRRLGLGRTAFYSLLKSGEIRAIKVGARTLIPESELQRFIASRLAQEVAA